MNTKNQRVVCAAIRYSDGSVITSARHHDGLMREIVSCMADRYRIPMDEVEEGFIDQYGTFLTRREAWKIAETNGQIIRRVGGDTVDGGTLYSENLY